MVNINFKKGEWEDFFRYVYNSRFPFKPHFYQENNCIVNGRNPQMRDGFVYTTIMTKEMYSVGTKIWFTSSFEYYGAPLITLTDTLEKDENGDLWYGVGQEIVVWEKGIHVFDFFIEDGNLKWYKLLGDIFPLATCEKHEVCVEIKDKYLIITIEGRTINLRVENLPEKFYIGITGCENINRIYNVKIEKA